MVFTFLNVQAASMQSCPGNPARRTGRGFKFLVESAFQKHLYAQRPAHESGELVHQNPASGPAAHLFLGRDGSAGRSH